MKNLWILSQAGEDDAQTVNAVPFGTEPGDTTGTTVPDDAPLDPNDPAATGSGKPQWLQFLPFIFLFVIMYMVLFRGPRKQQKKHKAMVSTLDKNDKVRTIGGIMGTVVDVRDDEVVLKVDESNNTKIRVIKSAIGKNLTKEQQQ